MLLIKELEQSKIDLDKFKSGFYINSRKDIFTDDDKLLNIKISQFEDPNLKREIDLML